MLASPTVFRTSLRAARVLKSGCSSRQLNTSTTAFPDKLAFAFDIDGVLKQGKYVLPQAKRVLELLNGKNAYNKPIPYLLITNGGGVPDAERRKILSDELGQTIGENQLVQSHTPIASYAHRYADEPVLVIGGFKDHCRRVAESYGLKHVFIPQDIIAWQPNLWNRTELTSEEWGFIKPHDFTDTQFKAVLVLHDSHDWGRDVTLICELMSSRNGVLGTQREHRDRPLPPSEILPLVFSNPDLEWKSDYALSRFGMGAFRIATEQIYKVSIVFYFAYILATTTLDLVSTQYGKPHTSTYQFAESMLRDHIASLGGKRDKELSVYMIGDNPESDIAGANAHGWNSCLLRTGVYETGTPSHEPTVIVDDVEKAIEWAIRREGGSI